MASYTTPPPIDRFSLFAVFIVSSHFFGVALKIRLFS
jgi:hypothetical protein